MKGKTIGIDASTLEANAALRSIVRRDTGESDEDFLRKLAKASGIGTPTRADLARLDRKRKKKGSNDDWTHPHDPDAKITKMKDGRTHLAHKAEHAIDLERRDRRASQRAAIFCCCFAHDLQRKSGAYTARGQVNMPVPGYAPGRRSPAAHNRALSADSRIRARSPRGCGRQDRGEAYFDIDLERQGVE